MRTIGQSDPLAGLATALAAESNTVATEHWSLAEGLGGVALAYWRAYSVLRNEELWNRALAVLETARALDAAGIGAVVSRESPSVSYGRAGLLAAQVWLARSTQDRRAAVAAFVDFGRLTLSQPINPDFVLGHAGLLSAIGALIPGNSAPDQARLRELGDSLLTALCTELQSLGRIQGNSRFRFLGMAHGWAGALYAALAYSRDSGTPVPASVVGRLDELAALGQRMRHVVVWPQLTDAPPQVWSGWCHGSAGHVHLWALATELLGDARYLHLALAAAAHAGGLPSSRAAPTLCCGMAGQGYALLRLYRLSGDERLLDRAELLAHRAVRTLPIDEGVRVGNIYKGMLGPKLFAVDIERPAEARMPVFQWPSRLLQ